jgi:flagellar hook-length control protein FliK
VKVSLALATQQSSLVGAEGRSAKATQGSASGTAGLFRKGKAATGFQALFQKILQATKSGAGGGAKVADALGKLGADRPDSKLASAATKNEARLLAARKGDARSGRLSASVNLTAGAKRQTEANKAGTESAKAAAGGSGAVLVAKKEKAAEPSEQLAANQKKRETKKGQEDKAGRDLLVRYDQAPGAQKVGQKKIAGAEGDSVEKADSGKKAKGKSERAKLDVYDYRTQGEAGAKEGAAIKAVEAEKSSGGQDHAADLLIDVSAHGGQGPAEAKSNSGAQAGNSTFAARLAERLQDSYNGQIVQHSAIVLRDGGSGLIRLNLKPETLGNVKVHLDLADNSITGTIVVESEAAKDIFTANLEHLSKSFVDSGFDSATLNVTVDNGSAQQGESRGQSAFGEQPGRNAGRGVELSQALNARGAYGGLDSSSALNILI